MVTRVVPPKFLAWLVLTLAAAGGMIAALASWETNNNQPDIERNGDLTVCMVGRVAIALEETGRGVIHPSEIAPGTPLGDAFDDLEDALETVDVGAACEAIE